ncbi:MAG: hypothetical protein HY897_00300 [Deltaproteobacteria bacterium]|nr:hypothetical protein [Deltaproteobacteria bacterium]
MHTRASNHVVCEFLLSLRPGAPVRAGVVWCVPVIGAADGPDADLLEEALGQGTSKVTEVGEQGRVGSVRVAHGGGRHLLVLNGEQVAGAKQDRVFNSSFIVPPGIEVDLPVSCVERGRWRRASDEFTSLGTTVSSRTRISSVRSVTDSLSRGRGYEGDQGAVWREVDGYLRRSCTPSATSAFADGFRSRSREVEGLLSGLSPCPGQVGLAAVLGDTMCLFDAFGSADLYRRGWKMVARGVLAEVYDDGKESSDPVGAVTRALRGLASLPLSRTPAPGCGETVSGHSAAYALSAVCHEGKLYHALAGGT